MPGYTVFILNGRRKVMSERSARRQVIAAACAMSRSGLSPGRSGNVSKRFESGFFITPSGMIYEDLSEDDIVFVGPDGSFGGGLKPSSEWLFHREIYLAKPDAGGIVHTHSRYATTLASAGRAIPAFHYMVAAAGGKEIRVAEYATFGTAGLASNVVRALGENRACLMAQHGQVAVGDNAFSALELAREVEELAAQYFLVLQLGGAAIIPDAEMDKVLEKFKSYGPNAADESGAAKNSG